RVTAAQTIDASGLVVAPGSTRPHTQTFDDLNSAAGRAPFAAPYSACLPPPRAPHRWIPCIGDSG
ncbi:MAG: hypothetical protein M3466_07860, partial [Gemmatimonadota bacterium]|nr:hypothetical protein [Gemmatimonadota bacterium]